MQILIRNVRGSPWSGECLLIPVRLLILASEEGVEGFLGSHSSLNASIDSIIRYSSKYAGPVHVEFYAVESNKIAITRRVIFHSSH